MPDPRAETDEFGLLKVTIPEQPVTPTLTAGEMIRRLQTLPPNVPVVGYFTGWGSWRGQPGAAEDYVNLTDLHFTAENGPGAVIEIRDTHDTRQY